MKSNELNLISSPRTSLLRPINQSSPINNIGGNIILGAFVHDLILHHHINAAKKQKRHTNTANRHSHTPAIKGGGNAAKAPLLTIKQLQERMHIKPSATSSLTFLDRLTSTARWLYAYMPSFSLLPVAEAAPAQQDSYAQNPANNLMITPGLKASDIYYEDYDLALDIRDLESSLIVNLHDWLKKTSKSAKPDTPYFTIFLNRQEIHSPEAVINIIDKIETWRKHFIGVKVNNPKNVPLYSYSYDQLDPSSTNAFGNIPINHPYIPNALIESRIKDQILSLCKKFPLNKEKEAKRIRDATILNDNYNPNNRKGANLFPIGNEKRTKIIIDKDISLSKSYRMQYLPSTHIQSSIEVVKYDLPASPEIYAHELTHEAIDRACGSPSLSINTAGSNKMLSVINSSINKLEKLKWSNLSLKHQEILCRVVANEPRLQDIVLGFNFENSRNLEPSEHKYLFIPDNLFAVLMQPNLSNKVMDGFKNAIIRAYKMAISYPNPSDHEKEFHAFYNQQGFPDVVTEILLSDYYKEAKQQLAKCKEDTVIKKCETAIKVSNLACDKLGGRYTEKELEQWTEKCGKEKAIAEKFKCKSITRGRDEL